MSEGKINKIKTSIKVELLEQAYRMLNNRLLHADLFRTADPSDAHEGEFQATLAACRELRDALSMLPETSEVLFDAGMHGLPHLDYSLTKLTANPVKDPS